MKDIDLYSQILGISKPWYVEAVELDKAHKQVTVKVGLKGRIAHKCPHCGNVVPGYDSVKRRWRHLDTMQFQTILEANLPRFNCPEHGVETIKAPWAEKGSRFTALFEALVIDLLKCCSQSEAAQLIGLSWKQVHTIMRHAVERGLIERSKEEAVYHNIGVDEKAYKKGHQYVTVVNAIKDSKPHVLFVNKDRTMKSLDEFYEEMLTG